MQRTTPLRVLTAAFLAGWAALPAQGQNLDLQNVGAGLAFPVWAGSPPGDSRIFVLEQFSRLVRVIDGGVLQAAPFLDLSAKANAGGGSGERGLLGMAFHPNFRDNGHFFVYYTANPTPGKSVIERYTASPSTSNVANPLSAKLVIEYAQPFDNHNSGGITFGPDGFLYIPTGDGGSANDPGCRAQNVNNILGKMLRIDIDVDPAPYVNPPSNPYVGIAGLDEIWATGLRNPWRMSFDRLTGDMYIGDVGQNSREEINYRPVTSAGGENYGWKVMEGIACGGVGACGVVAPCNDPSYTLPIHDYAQGGGGGCTVVGGYVYRGCAMPFFQGTYVYADYCNGQVRTFQVVGGVDVNHAVITADLGAPAGVGGRITSFGEDGWGEILMTDYTIGRIYRIVPQVPQTPDPLCASGHFLSIEQGGTQFLRVQPGVAQAGQLYWLFGSVTGTSPGFPVPPSFVLPVNVDGYFLFTLQFPNSGLPLVNTFNVLDGAGLATAEWRVPAAALGATLAGVTFNHAGVVFDILGNSLAVTNAQPLMIKP